MYNLAVVSIVLTVLGLLLAMYGTYQSEYHGLWALTLGLISLGLSFLSLFSLALMVVFK